MTVFLAWVFAQATKVYDWFGDQYNYDKQVVSSTWTWIQNAIGQAIQSSGSYAWSLFTGAENDIRGLFDWVTYQINNLPQTLSGLVSSVETQVSAWFDVRLQDVWTFAQDLFNTAQTTIRVVQTDIQSWVNGLIPGIIASAQGALAWLTVIRSTLESLASLFTFGNISKVSKLLGDWWSTITLFLDNPVVFLLDLLEPVVLSFLDFVLAWALGTTENDLPTQPPWRK